MAMRIHNRNKTVYLGLSGGVDSSVAAALLLEQGYQVVPVFMKCWSDEAMGWKYAGACPWQEDLDDAYAVCEKLGIAAAFRAWNFEREYRETVLEPYLEDTKRGLTPNPDVTCNETIKFGLFFERALAEGADYVATGHYARVRKIAGARRVPSQSIPDPSTCSGSGLPPTRQFAQEHASPQSYHTLPRHIRSLESDDEGTEWKLLTAQCEPKNDQTYFLHRMTQAQLSRTLFPIGKIGTKAEVRARARALGLPTSDKRSTRGICFVGKGRHNELIASAVERNPGPIVTIAGRTVGEHEGVARYTIGQSGHLGITHAHGGPYYVVEKDLAANTLVVVPPAETWRLWQKEIVARNVHWIAGESPSLPLRAHAAIRHPQQDLAAPCLVAQIHADDTQNNADSDGRRKSASMSASVRVRFEEQQWAPCPGQSVVFYDERKETVLGGGVIDSSV